MAEPIAIKVRGRSIMAVEPYEPPSAGDVATCRVSFDVGGEGWVDLARKYVTFYGCAASVGPIDFEVEMDVPWEVMREPGEFRITLTGCDADGSEVMRTHEMPYGVRVDPPGKDAGDPPSEPTKTAIARIDNLAADLEEKRDTDYWRGEPGKDGAPGEPGADGYSPTANVTKDGGTATITITDKNGTTTATVSDGAPGSDASATDVRINGKSITTDGVADIPIAYNSNRLGLVKTLTNMNYGIQSNDSGLIYLSKADNVDISRRINNYAPLTTTNYDYAVKAAMTDGKGAAWTADEQKAARERMNAADANKVYIMQKQIENLQGIAATEETDSTEAYTKTVPTGAQKWASLDSVGGKIVVWNQLFTTVPSATFDGITTTYDATSGTLSCIGTTIGTYFFIVSNQIVQMKDHKYYLRLGDGYTFKIDDGNTNSQQTANTSESVLSFTTTGANMFRIGVFSSTEHPFSIGDSVNITFKPMLIDLTSAFGAGNEPTSLDDPRVAFIKAYAEEHPEYNPGELMSAEVVEVESRGKNLAKNGIAKYDYNTDYKKFNENSANFVEAGTYTISNLKKYGDAYYIQFFNEDKTIIPVNDVAKHSATSNVGWDSLCLYGVVNTETITINRDCIMTVCGTGDTDNGTMLQIERGTTATPYSPYGVKGTFPIPQSVREMCPGYGWSAGTVCNEIDFARKVYVQRVGSVDLGTLKLSKGNASNIDEGYFGYYLEVSTNFPQMKPSVNAVCGRFFYHPQTIMWEDMPADSFFANAYLHFQAKYDTIQDFKAAMQGVLLYYELATPIEVDLSDVLPDDHYIEVEAGGTVTFKQASTQLPVPSSVTYQISTSEVIANA